MDYPAVFTKLVDGIIGKEGHYSNDPADSGGATCWGITQAEARAFGYEGDMQNMPRDDAVSCYWKQYWVQPMLDQLAEIDSGIAGKLLDIGVNCGSATAGKFLQRALNVLGNMGKSYPVLTVDGACGGMTRAALRKYIALRGQDGRKVLLGMIISLQSVYYIDIAETRPSQDVFEFGWQLQRAVGTAFSGA